jgi:hypothetical protein
MSQFTDMVPYVLALLAKLLTHVTTISQDRSLISRWVFGLSNAEMYSSSGFAIRRIPICRYDDSWPYNGRFSLGRDSGLRNSKVYGLLVHEIPDSAILDFLKWEISRHMASVNRMVQIYPGVSTLENRELFSTGIPILRFPIS